MSTLLTLASKGMNSYTILASVCLAASAQSSPKRSVSCGISHGVPGMLPTLMWWAPSSAAASKSSSRISSEASRPLVAGVEEPVHEELELEVAQAVVVEGLLHLRQALRLEHVLQVGVPDADAAEPDLARLGAAVGPAEQAPLAPDVHLDRTGDRPVEADQLDVAAHFGR